MKNNRKIYIFVCIGLCAIIAYVYHYYSSTKKACKILDECGRKSIKYNTYYDSGAVGYLVPLLTKQKLYDFMLELKEFPNGTNVCYVHVVGKINKHATLDYGDPRIRIFVDMNDVKKILQNGLPEWGYDILKKEIQHNNWRSGCRFSTGKTITLTLGIRPEKAIENENKRRKNKSDNPTAPCVDTRSRSHTSLF